MDNPFRIDFMIIGARNSGTSSLANELNLHPKISKSKRKEVRFFSRHADWEERLDEYHAQFRREEAGDGALFFEAPHEYTHLHTYPETASRLKAYNPDLKFIYILRDPVDRMVSQYNNQLLEGLHNVPPEKFLSDYEGAMDIVNISRYGINLKNYQETFGAENILVLIFEEYIKDKVSAWRQICQFLEVDDSNVEQWEDLHLHPAVGREYKTRELRKLRKKVVYRYLYHPLRFMVPNNLKRSIKEKRFIRKIDRKVDFTPGQKKLLYRFVEFDIDYVESQLGRAIPSWRSKMKQVGCNLSSKVTTLDEKHA